MNNMKITDKKGTTRQQYEAPVCESHNAPDVLTASDYALPVMPLGDEDETNH